MAKLHYITVFLVILGLALASPLSPADISAPAASPPDVSAPGPSPHASGVCSTSGRLICSSDCKRLILCNHNGDDFEEIVVQDCGSVDGDRYCDSREGTCHLGLTSCSPMNPPVYHVQCNAVGLYPDPYDCSVFHMCQTTGNLSEVFQCPAPWAYDPMFSRCDYTYDYRPCTQGPIPKCEYAGQSGPVPENPNIFYVCVKQAIGFAPEMHRCDNNGYYTGIECIDISG